VGIRTEDLEMALNRPFKVYFIPEGSKKVLSVRE